MATRIGVIALFRATLEISHDRFDNNELNHVIYTLIFRLRYRKIEQYLDELIRNAKQSINRPKFPYGLCVPSREEERPESHILLQTQ